MDDMDRFFFLSVIPDSMCSSAIGAVPIRDILILLEAPFIFYINQIHPDGP